MDHPNRFYETIVIGGGQAGLATGFYLKQHGQNFIILDANERTGDSWRNRWDSLHLFTPARYDGLPEMPFPASAFTFPTKDKMADYLESYAAHFDLPVQTGVRVEHLTQDNGRFQLAAGDMKFEADNVVVAMSEWQKPRVPSFADELDPGIIQMHSSEYQNPLQLQEGNVLLVGAGNSGAEIAMDIVPEHSVWLSGRDNGHVPFRIGGFAYRLITARLFAEVLFRRVLTINTPIGRKARQNFLNKGLPLVRTKPKDLAAAGVQRVPRTTGVQDGLPRLEDGHVLEVTNVIWCTGYLPGFSWIELPVFGDDGPIYERGVVANMPGLYFVGQTFLFSPASSMIHGVGKDAEYIVKALQSRQQAVRQKAGEYNAFPTT